MDGTKDIYIYIYIYIYIEREREREREREGGGGVDGEKRETDRQKESFTSITLVSPSAIYSHSRLTIAHSVEVSENMN